MSGRTLSDVMAEKGLTRYRLAKTSGIPWSTLSNICTGKTSLQNCSARTVSRLADALDMPVEEVMDLETGVITRNNGTPRDQSYLEVNLPPDLETAIRDLVECEDGCLHLDCFLDELYGSINWNLHCGRISEGQAAYLRAKYLGIGDGDD